MGRGKSRRPLAARRTIQTDTTPTDARGWVRLARARLALDHADEARAALEQAVALRPSTPGLWCDVAELRVALGDLAAAEEAYQQALARSAHHQRARRGLAALPADRPRPRRPRRRRRLVLVAALLPLLALIVHLRHDSQAIPKLVDAVRGVVGDAVVLRLEEVVFGTRDWLEDHLPTGRRAVPVAAVQPPAQATAAVKAADERPPQLGGDDQDGSAGRWQDRGRFFVTHVYPEPSHRSIVDVAWIKRGARLHVACGTREPAEGEGAIAAPHLTRTFLAFSGGFQYKHFPGAIMSEGCLLSGLRSGIGTLIVLHDNQVRIGKWGREWDRILPAMKDLRQCLLLVDGGQFNEDVNFNAYAIGSAVRVYRSALGVTERGNLVYAAGDRLSARALAQTLIACGARSAVHLDMNYGNATCGVVEHGANGPTIRPLTERFPDPSRFLGRNYRDFMYVEAGDSPA